MLFMHVNMLFMNIKNAEFFENFENNEKFL